MHPESRHHWADTVVEPISNNNIQCIVQMAAPHDWNQCGVNFYLEHPNWIVRWSQLVGGGANVASIVTKSFS